MGVYLNSAQRINFKIHSPKAQPLPVPKLFLNCSARDAIAFAFFRLVSFVAFCITLDRQSPSSLLSMPTCVARSFHNVLANASLDVKNASQSEHTNRDAAAVAPPANENIDIIS